MTVLVLGAGVIGVAAAWFLRAAGHDVRVVDRRDGAALESSYANAGQVSAHLADPWSNPSTLKMLPRWLLQADAPLVWRPRLRWDQWRWLALFLRECNPERYSRNLLHLANIGLYSRETLRELRRETGIAYDFHQGGILLFHTDPAALDQAAAAARKLEAHGLKRRVCSREECVSIEPALAHMKERIAGGIFSPYDETGDAHQFARALARLGAERGIRFDYGITVRRLLVEGGEAKGAEVEHADGRREELRASHTVVCMGPFSTALLASVGVPVDIYPVKGYSITMPVVDEAAALRIGITDASVKVAFSRLGDRIRATSTAEVADFDAAIDSRRCEALVGHVQRLFPGAGDAARAVHWAGLRPTTPSNLPYVGKTRVRGLLVNAGHGTVGWTQACGSGRALAEILAGRRPEVDFPFVGLD
jgi:D-amino-acid dehydrogenase